MCVAIALIMRFTLGLPSYVVPAPEEPAAVSTQEDEATETTEIIESEPVVYLAEPMTRVCQEEVASGSSTVNEEGRKGEESLAAMEAARAEREAQIAALFTEDDVVMMAQLIDIEAGAVYPLYRRAAVAWTVLNRLDSDRWYPTTISGIITQNDQYAWYAGRNYMQINYDIARDVLTRWATEKVDGKINSGRVLPESFDSFYGGGNQNYFYDVNGSYWDFGIEVDPYADF